MVADIPYVDIVKGEETQVMLFARTLNNAVDEKGGVLILAVEEPVYRSLYQDISTEGQLFLVNEAGTISSTEDSSLIGCQLSQVLEIPDDMLSSTQVQG